MQKITSMLKVFLLNLLFLLTCGFTFSQVGINTTSPSTTLDVNGAFSLREGPELQLKFGQNNNIILAPETFSRYRIIGPTSAFSITGIVPVAAADGQMITLINSTAEPMTFEHNASSLSSNRIFCPGERNLTLHDQYSSATLQYNQNLMRWLIVSTSGNTKKGATSVSFVGEVEIDFDNFKNYEDIPGMTVSFVAENTTAMVFFTTSAQFRRSSATDGEVFLRVLNQDNDVIGGTALASRIGENLESLSFSKLMTNLIPGNTYTLRVQGKITRSGLGNPRYVVKPSERETDHLTLSIMQ